MNPERPRSPSLLLLITFGFRKSDRFTVFNVSAALAFKDSGHRVITHLFELGNCEGAFLQADGALQSLGLHDEQPLVFILYPLKFSVSYGLGCLRILFHSLPSDGRSCNPLHMETNYS